MFFRSTGSNPITFLFPLPPEHVYRDCLPDGTWFSCPSTFGDPVGWTNYSHCWSKTTQKLMDDLNYKPTCPTNVTDNGEVTVEVSSSGQCLLPNLITPTFKPFISEQNVHCSDVQDPGDYRLFNILDCPHICPDHILLLQVSNV